MENKKTTWIILILVLVVAVFAVIKSGIFAKKEPIHIAAVFNQDSIEGEQRAINALEMYIENLNKKENGFNGHQIELDITFITGDVDQAQSIAEDLAANSNAIAVLGNGYSNQAMAMGEVYAANELLAITSGAGTPAVTEGNKWFFRTINDNSAQGKFVAEYARVFLGYEKAAVIYNDNKYGVSLGAAFSENFAAQGGEIINYNAVSDSSETLDEDIEGILADYETKPDMVFLASYRPTAVAAVISLRNKYPNLPILISSEAANSSFADLVATKLGKSNTDGLLDGVYSVSPLIFDVASEGAQLFQDAYIKKYEDTPSWYAATTYDSIALLIDAMQATGISGEPETLQADRQLLRDYLESKNSLENSFQGISGKIFFNENHSLEQPMAMGIFENDRFISAPVQLYSMTRKELPTDYLNKLTNGDILKINNSYYGKTRIVYVGVDINEFDDLDIDGDRTYLADFYLWFRYKGEKLNYTDIHFDNCVDEIVLDTPMEEKNIDDGHYVVFKVRNTFRNTFNLSDYPFDLQKLSIKLRHTALERKDIIFVTDLLGIGEISETAIQANLKEARAFDTINDWFPVTGYYFADTVRNFGTRGDPDRFDAKSAIEHSRFNVAIEIQRDYVRFVSKTMLPIFAILALSYLALFLPDREFETITSIMTGTVLSVIFFHVDLSGRLNVGYPVAMDYVFYAIYALLATEVYLSIVAWRRISIKDRDMSVKYLFWFMRALYPIVFIGLFVWIATTFHLL